MRKMGLLSNVNVFKPEDGDEKFAEIVDAADLLTSYCRSMAEAVFRADVTLLRLYRPEFHGRVAELISAIPAVAPVADRRAA
jgi:hypothetical protein